MYYSKIVSLTLLVITIGTGLPAITKLTTIDGKTPTIGIIEQNVQTPPQNKIALKSNSNTLSKSYNNVIEASKQTTSKITPKITQTIGDTKLYWVPDVSTYPMNHYQINATLVAKGKHCLVYSNLTGYDSDLLALNDTFETSIYQNITSFFGFPPDVDSNGNITILAFDIDEISGGYVAGFFYPLNQYPKGTYPYSNEEEIIHIDVLTVDNLDYATVAHEFQHLIHFGHDDDENVWLDEGASMFAEFLINEDPFQSGPYKSNFQSNPDVSLTYWDPDALGLVFANYGASYAFFLYLAEHYGGSSIIQDIVSETDNGIGSIEDALLVNGYPVEFKEVFRNWTIANFLDDTSLVNGEYGYYNTTLTMNIEDTYSTSSVARTENSITYWGTDYLEFTDRTGLPFVLDFQGDITEDFIVTAILTNTTTNPQGTVVVPIPISADEYGNFSTEERGLSADEIVIAVSACIDDYDDDNPSPEQDYWFIINPEGIIISYGDLEVLGDILNLWNIEVFDQEENYWKEADGATYDILTDSGDPTGISGDLSYNTGKNYWEAKGIDISSLPKDDSYYRVKYHFFNSTHSGIAFSDRFRIDEDFSSSSSTTNNTGISSPGFVMILLVLSISVFTINRKKR